MGAALQREAEALFGPDVDLGQGGGASAVPPVDSEDEGEDSPGRPAPSGESASAPASRRPLTSREYRRLWSHVRRIENFWTTLKELEPGAVARLAQTAGERAWEVIFLTQRPSTVGETAQRQSQRWLAAQGFDLPSVFVVDGSRGLVARSLALDLVIDDRPENCLDVATDSIATPILVWRDSAASAPPGAARMRIETVFSFADAMRRLEAAGDAAAPVPGLKGRIRRALGL